jgi:DNA-binding IclR family transcriptional regulator
MPQTQSKGEHQNLARIVQVLDALSAAAPVGLRQKDIADTTGLSPAVVNRLCQGMQQYGMADFDGSTGRYFIAADMLRWTASALNRYGLWGFADASLQRLVTLTQDTIYFALLSGSHSICVDRREGNFPLKTLTVNVGDKRPLGIGAASLAILSFQEDAFICAQLEDPDALAKRQVFALENEELRRLISRTQETGYARIEGTLIPGMTGVAVPIRNAKGIAIASIAVTGLNERLSGTRGETVINALRSEVQTITEAAGDVLETPLARKLSAVG